MYICTLTITQSQIKLRYIVLFTYLHWEKFYDFKTANIWAHQ